MGSRCNKKVLSQIRDFDHMAVLRLNFCLSKFASQNQLLLGVIFLLGFLTEGQVVLKGVGILDI